MKITKSVNLKKVDIEAVIVEPKLTAKQKLEVEAKELGIDVTDMTSAQLKTAIAAAKEAAAK